MNKLKTILSLIIIGISAFFMTGCLGGGAPIPTFSVSGYVLDGQKGVEGVTVRSDVGTTQTDENGYYVFTGLVTGITITVEKENYAFVQNTKTIFNQTEDANFVALPYYNVSGYVKSGDLGVENVKVTATGLKSGFTYTSKDGSFVIYDIAGEVVLHAEKSGYAFFDKTVENGETPVVINATTTLSGNINFIGKSQEDKNLVKVYVDEGVYTLDENCEFQANEIKLGTVIEPKCDGLVFSPKQIIVTKEDQDIIFECQKLYNYSGVVKSGDYLIENAKITCGDIVVYTNEQGEFVLTNLLGENEIKIEHNKFVFENININELSSFS